MKKERPWAFYGARAFLLLLLTLLFLSMASSWFPGDLQVQAQDGMLLLEPEQGRPGDMVSFGGTGAPPRQWVTLHMTPVPFLVGPVAGLFTNEDGSFSGDFKVPEVADGTYTLELHYVVVWKDTTVASATFTVGLRSTAKPGWGAISLNPNPGTLTGPQPGCSQVAKSTIEGLVNLTSDGRILGYKERAEFRVEPNVGQPGQAIRIWHDIGTFFHVAPEGWWLEPSGYYLCVPKQVTFTLWSSSYSWKVNARVDASGGISASTTVPASASPGSYELIVNAVFEGPGDMAGYSSSSPFFIVASSGAGFVAYSIAAPDRVWVPLPGTYIPPAGLTLNAPLGEYRVVGSVGRNWPPPPQAIPGVPVHLEILSSPGQSKVAPTSVSTGTWAGSFEATVTLDPNPGDTVVKITADMPGGSQVSHTITITGFVQPPPPTLPPGYIPGPIVGAGQGPVQGLSGPPKISLKPDSVLPGGQVLVLGENFGLGYVDIFLDGKEPALGGSYTFTGIGGSVSVTVPAATSLGKHTIVAASKTTSEYASADLTVSSPAASPTPTLAPEKPTPTLVLVPTLTPSAQPTFGIKGKVTKIVTGRALGGIHLALDLPGGSVMRTDSNASGEYSFIGLHPGRYTLVPFGASGLRFAPSEQYVELTNHDVVRVDFKAGPAFLPEWQKCSDSGAQGLMQEMPGQPEPFWQPLQDWIPSGRSDTDQETIQMARTLDDLRVFVQQWDRVVTVRWGSDASQMLLDPESGGPSADWMAHWLTAADRGGIEILQGLRSELAIYYALFSAGLGDPMDAMASIRIIKSYGGKFPAPSCSGPNLRLSGESPFAFFVTDSEGRAVGADPLTLVMVNTIPGATYTGPQAEPQVVQVPYPSGEYTVILVPLGSGEYHITVEGLEDGKVVQTASFAGDIRESAPLVQRLAVGGEGFKPVFKAGAPVSRAVANATSTITPMASSTPSAVADTTIPLTSGPTPKGFPVVASVQIVAVLGIGIIAVLAFFFIKRRRR